jgi:hypothetical protein
MASVGSSTLIGGSLGVFRIADGESDVHILDAGDGDDVPALAATTALCRPVKASTWRSRGTAVLPLQRSATVSWAHPPRGTSMPMRAT